ncbi:nucleotidyltransferase family protein [Candidatus Woesearchaeota archaeon]|nr:nucleotidyltransferase family protein [Candidatus Woesearchaeota archaeon]
MFKTAVILAGGLGTRLKPLTDDIPKPLLLIKETPILEHIVQNLKKYGIKKIIVSIGYKAELIQDYFKTGKQHGVEIKYIIEDEPLGTGGALKKAAEDLHDPFFLLWGDNLMDINFKLMYSEFIEDPCSVMMALSPRNDVENFGVAEINKGKITYFIEKPERNKAPSNLINAGAMIVNPSCLSILPEGKSSAERDCFEKLAIKREVRPFLHKGQWFPTDTLEKYYIANNKFKPINN